MSGAVYFAWVATTTVLGFGVAAFFRPSLAHTIRATLGLERQLEAAPDSFYALRVAPLFEDHCSGCHGERRQKAELRLDSFAAAMRGGKHGPVITAGSVPQSELVARISLPASDDKAMPPEGRMPLTVDDVTVIKLWIAAGASHVQPTDAIHGAPPPVAKITFPAIDAAAVEKQRAPLAQIVKQLQAQYPQVIAYESRGSADLEVNASLMHTSFGDTQLAALAPLRDHIVRADFSGTSITDASAAHIAGMKHLRTLRLMNTAVTDVTTQTLQSLNALQSLTVIGTAATEESLRPMRDRGVRIYGGEDRKDPAPPQAASPGDPRSVR